MLATGVIYVNHGASAGSSGMCSDCADNPAVRIHEGVELFFAEFFSDTAERFNPYTPVVHKERPEIVRLVHRTVCILVMDGLSSCWTNTALARLARSAKAARFPKTINDPIWGNIEIFPWEATLLDSPILQRLRGIRQLGMAHQVYPGATHTRFEHSLGVLEAAERMISALGRNADRRRTFGRERDEGIPAVSEQDHFTIRLAALLHDIGHAPFSHATEAVVRETAAPEFDAVDAALRSFDDVGRIATGEALACLLLLADPIRDLFVHDRFGLPVSQRDVAATLCARILGSSSNLETGYLKGVVSGALDADKLDYMARDSHHSGLPLGLDLDRIINKLEVIIITPRNAPTAELRREAESSPRNRVYEMGISAAGVGAFEQMIIARVFLYDRLYYHHKVRSAEAMVRNLITVAAEERGAPLTTDELVRSLSDETLIAILGREVTSVDVRGGDSRAAAIAQSLRSRELYHRAYVFGQSFIGGLTGLPDEQARTTRQLIWDDVLGVVSDETRRKELESAIYARGVDICQAIPELRLDGLLREHVVVDLPTDRVTVGSKRILIRTEGGSIQEPNLFFNPERWSKAYQEHRQLGFVFCPARFVTLVAAAAHIVFAERFKLFVTQDAYVTAKTEADEIRQIVRDAAARGLCAKETADSIAAETPQLKRLYAEDLRLPEQWLVEKPDLPTELAGGFAEALPAGLPGNVFRDTIDLIEHLAMCVVSITESGELVERPT